MSTKLLTILSLALAVGAGAKAQNAYVANQASNNVSVIDTSSNTCA